MFTLLPAVCLILLFFILIQTPGSNWRSTILRSALVWGITLTIMTEVLSLFTALTFAWVAGLWTLVISLLLLFSYSCSSKKKDKAYLHRILGKAKVFLANSYLRNPIVGVIIITAFLGLIALVAPPNTNDSMGYHMPRVVHWIQNQSVAHYPTSYTAQLYLSPWSAFAILHLQILSGGDRYANLIQLCSMIGSIVGVSLIAQQLGANIYGQMLAAVFCATLPMGILQASSTQNDYIVAFWLMCLIYYTLLTLEKRPDKTHFFEIGISLGLAILTKPTAYIYAFPFMVWLFLSHLKSERWKIGKPQLWKAYCQVLIPAFFINLGHYSRNFSLFHTPLGKPPQFITYTNQAFNIPILLSNIIRNLSLHTATPSPKLNQILFDILNWIHSILNVDINDPRTSGLDFQINSLINHEDLAGNPLHLFLIFLSILCLAFLWKNRFSHHWLLSNYTLSLVTCFILFCSILTWTPFHSRLQLSMFVIASPLVGLVFSKIFRPRALSFMAILLIFLSLPWLFFNETRPLIANSQFITEKKIENIFNTRRDDLYFMGQRYLKEPIIGATQFIKSQKCSNIGLSFYYMKVFEYPVWALLQKGEHKPYHLQHIGVTNESQVKYELSPFRDFRPCLVLNDIRSDFESASEQYKTYDKVWFLSPMSVLKKAK